MFGAYLSFFGRPFIFFRYNILMSQAIRTVLEAEIKNAFFLFDRLGDGHIESKDLGTLMRSLGFDMGEETASVLAEMLDEKDEGYISFPNFRKYFINKLNSKELKDDFKLAFEIIDADRDKLISFNDLKSFLQTAGEKRTEEEINEMISDADIDGDGYINFEEFCRLMATR